MLADNKIAKIVVNTACYVHKMLDPGLLESVYEELIKDGITRIVNSL